MFRLWQQALAELTAGLHCTFSQYQIGSDLIQGSLYSSSFKLYWLQKDGAGSPFPAVVKRVLVTPFTITEKVAHAPLRDGFQARGATRPSSP